MNFNLNWIPWGIGWMIPFLIKYTNYLLQETEIFGAKVPLTNIVVTDQRWGLPVATLRYLVGDTKTAIITFVAFTWQLILGAWYIDGLPLPYMDKIIITKHWAIAFGVSASLEMALPMCVRGSYSWVGDKINRLRGVQVAPKPTEE